MATRRSDDLQQQLLEEHSDAAALREQFQALDEEESLDEDCGMERQHNLVNTDQVTHATLYTDELLLPQL